MSNWEGFYDGNSRGLCMIPIVPNSKKPYIKWKKYQTQKSTVEEIREWEKKFPDANPCVICGSISDVIVLDLDGPEAHEYILNKYGPLPYTVVTKTPGGIDRYHYWYRYPRELGIVHNFTSGYNKEMPHVDLKADGGYVLYAGAVHKSGGTYQFRKGCTPNDVEIPAPPFWLLEQIDSHNQEKDREAQEFLVQTQRAKKRLKSKLGSSAFQRRLQQYGNAVMRNQVSLLENTVEGGRNTQLFMSAASLAPFVRENVFSYSEVESALIRAAIACGLDRDEAGMTGIKNTLKSGFSRGYGENIGLSEDFQYDNEKEVIRVPRPYKTEDSEALERMGALIVGGSK